MAEMVYPNPDDPRAAHALEVDQGAVKEADRFEASMANRNDHVREQFRVYDHKKSRSHAACSILFLLPL